MFRKIGSNFVIALCTAATMIAFAFYQRYETSFAVSTTAFFLTAALICLLPVAYGLIRCKSCVRKSARVA